MRIPRGKLTEEEATTGSRPEVPEEVVRPLELLEGFRGHPVPKGRWTLDGGTAASPLLLDLPRGPR